MKKKVIIILCLVASFVAVITVYHCITSPAKIPTKELAYLQLDAKGEAFVLEQIQGLSREQLIECWGEPNGIRSDLFGDVWEITENESITVYYSSKFEVERIKLIQEAE